jgi:hypothetical protein
MYATHLVIEHGDVVGQAQVCRCQLAGVAAAGELHRPPQIPVPREIARENVAGERAALPCADACHRKNARGDVKLLFRHFSICLAAAGDCQFHRELN